MSNSLRISLILTLSIVETGLLIWLCTNLRDYLCVKFNINFSLSRIDRLIRSSKRRLRKLNQSASLDGMRHLFTLVDGNEKDLIEEYCRSENISMNEFLRSVVVNDVKSWKSMKDELQLIFGPQPAPAKSPKTTEEHLHKLRQFRRVEAIFFRLPSEEYDKVRRHVERGQLSERYYGRLAVANINRKQR
jgi:hypothetical protein